MNRTDAMYKILNFGRNEERELIQQGKLHEAYQIEHARNTLIYFLNKNPIKNIADKIEKMTSYNVDEDGYWHYDLEFVTDEMTRGLLVALKTAFLSPSATKR